MLSVHSYVLLVHCPNIPGYLVWVKQRVLTANNFSIVFQLFGGDVTCDLGLS